MSLLLDDAYIQLLLIQQLALINNSKQWTVTKYTCSTLCKHWLTWTYCMSTCLLRSTALYALWTGL